MLIGTFHANLSKHRIPWIQPIVYSDFPPPCSTHGYLPQPGSALPAPPVPYSPLRRRWSLRRCPLLSAVAHPLTPFSLFVAQYGVTPLMIAAANGHPQCLAAFIAAGAEYDAKSSVRCCR